QSFATGINNLGQVVGYATTATGDGHAFIATDGVMTDLGFGVAGQLAINDYGQVVGRRGTPPAVPFLYSDGVMTNLNDQLPPNSGWILTDARGINDAGQIVGYGSIIIQSHYETHACLLTPTDGPHTASGKDRTSARVAAELVPGAQEFLATPPLSVE